MSSPPAKEKTHHRQLNHELRNIISVLTGFGKADNVGSDDDAMGIITLAGTNKGAMMKMEGSEGAADQIPIATAGEGTEAFANSNYQSINNSIVIGGSCGAEDPGVHLIIQDYEDGDGKEEDEIKSEKKKKSKEEKKDKKDKKEKKKKKEKSGDEKQQGEAKNDESADDVEKDE